MNLKKIIALALCVCMVLSFFPVSVFAEDWEDEVVLVDEEEYFEPQDEYVEEEIIEEEPADYAEYVEPAEELIVEEELIDEEPAAEEPAAEEPAAPAEEPAAAVTAELETAETFNAAYVAKITTTDGLDTLNFGTFQSAYNAAGNPSYEQGGVTYALSPVIDLVADGMCNFEISKDITVNGANHTISGTFQVTGGIVTVYDAALPTTTVSGGTLTINRGSVAGLAVSGGEAVLKNTQTTDDYEIFVNGGTLTITGGNYGDVLASNNPAGEITGNVTGGTFARLSKVLLADGYVTPDYATSLKKYCQGTVTSADTEAMVGTAATGRTYDTLTVLAGGTEVPKLLKDANYTLSSGTLKVKLNGHVVNFTLPDGTYAEVDGPDTDGVTTYTLKPAVAIATVNGVANYYSKFEDAIDAAYYGGTVELLTDVEYDVWNQNLGKGYNVGPTDLTIDGKNHIWTVRGLNGNSNGNGNDLFHYATNLTVKNITVFQACDSTTAGAVTMMQGFGMNSGLLDHVTIIGGRFATVPTGSITIKDCTFGGMSTALYWENEPGRQFEITGTTFKNCKATDVMGAMTFQNNTIESTATLNFGYNFPGAELSEEAQAKFTGNTIEGTVNLYQDGAVKANDLSKATLAVQTYREVDAVDLSGNYFGDSLPANIPEQVVISSVATTTAYTATTPVVASVLDGQGKETFYATLADAVTAAGTGTDSKVISLMADISDAYAIAADQTLNVKHNGKTLNVTFSGNKVFGDLDAQTGVTTYVSSASAEAQIGDTPYATLADALAAAATGDNKTITLLKDVQLTDRVWVSSGVTIDGKGFTIMPADAPAFNDERLITDSGYAAGSSLTLINLADNVTGVTIKNVTVTSTNSIVNPAKKLYPRALIGTGANTTITLENVTLNHTSTTIRGGDALALNGDCTIVGKFSVALSERSWSAISFNTTNEKLYLDNCTDFDITSDTRTGTQPIIIAWPEGSAVTGFEDLGFVDVEGGTVITQTGFEPKTSSKIGNATTEGSIYNFKAGDEYFTTFKAAAEYAKAQTTATIVEVFKAPADGDTYELTAGTLQVKLNGKVTGDAAIKALVTSTTGVPKIETVGDVTTYTWVEAVAKVDGTLYTTIEEAVSAAGTTKVVELMANATYTMALGQVIKVRPGTFKFVAKTEGNKWLVVEEDLGEGVFKYEVSATEPEARIGDQAYATLTDALAAAQDDDVVTLLKDVTYDNRDYTGASYTIGKKITLNGDGHTITTDATGDSTYEKWGVTYSPAGRWGVAVNVAASGVTIENITIISKNGQCVTTNSGCDITLNNVYLDHSEGAKGDALMLNGNCDINGTFGFAANSKTWHGVVQQEAGKVVDFTDCTEFDFTLVGDTAPGQAFFGTYDQPTSTSGAGRFVGLDSLSLHAYAVQGGTKTPVTFAMVDATTPNQDAGFEPSNSAKLETKFIATVDGVYYETFNAAADAAKAANSYVELVGKEGTTYDTYSLSTGTVSVKLNGKVSDPLSLVKSASASWAVKADFNASTGITAYSLNGPVVATVDGVTYLKFKDAAAVAIANDKTVEMSNKAVLDADDTITLEAGQTLKVKKNTINTDAHVPEEDDTIITISDPDADGVTTYSCAKAVANVKTGDTLKGKYTTLEAAVAAARNGDTVNMLSNAEIKATLSLATGVTLDGHDFTISPGGNSFKPGLGDGSAIALIATADAVTGVTVQNVKLTSFSNEWNADVVTSHLISCKGVGTFKNIEARQYSTRTKGADVFQFNGSGTFEGVITVSMGPGIWSPISLNKTDGTPENVSFAEGSSLVIKADERIKPQAMIRTHGYETNVVEGTENIGYVPVFGKASGVYSEWSGYESKDSDLIGSVDEPGTLYNYKVGDAYYETFNAAATDAGTNVVELFATPAQADTFTLTEGTTLKVKLNGKADAENYVIPDIGFTLDVSDPDQDGVVTCSLVAQNFNLAHMNNGDEVVDAYYDNFADALAAIGAGQYINIYASVNNFAFAADTPVFYLKANGEAEFTYTYPNGYEILTRPDSAGSGSTRYECAVKTYTITYANIEGATPAAPQPTTYKTTQGDTIEVVTREHYTFDSWTVSATTVGETVNFTLDDNNHFAEGCYGDVTLTANWTADVYTVTFDPDNGGDTWTENVTYPGTLTRPTDPTKTGYTLDTTAEGWYRGENPWRFGWTVQSNMTLKAKWNANAYTVKFDGNGSTSGSMNDQAFAYDAAAQKLTQNNFTKLGYTFQGWAQTADAQEVEFEDQESVSNLTAEPNGEVTLYAVWKANSYFFRFNGNGSTSGEMADQEFTVDDFTKTLTANAFTKDGYTFDKWTLQAGGSGSVFANEAPITANWSNVDGKVIDLYAQWTPTPYTLTLDPNNGVQAETSPYTIEGSAVLPKPTYAEHVFKGWKVTIADGNWTQDDVVSNGNYPQMYGDVTLTAQWTLSEAYTTDKGEYVEYHDTVDDALKYIVDHPTFFDVGAVPTIAADDVVYELKTANATVKVDENGTNFKAVSKVDGKYAFRDPADGTWKLTDYVAKLYTFSYSTRTDHDGTVYYTYTDPVPADQTSAGNGYETFAAAIEAYRGLSLAATERAYIELIANTDEKYELEVGETVYFYNDNDPDYQPTFLDPDADHQQTAPVLFTGDGIDPDHNITVPAYIYSVTTDGAATLTLKVADNSPEGARFYVAGATPNVWFYEGDVYTVKGAVGSAYTLPSGINVTAKGYVFDGWYDENGDKVDLPAAIDATMTYTATWAEDWHTITFDTDGGNPINPITQMTDLAITWPEDPVKEGSTFDGWYKQIDDGEGNITEEKITTYPTVMPAENYTVKAHWKLNTHDIRWMYNKEDGKQAQFDRTKKVPYGTQITPPEGYPIVLGQTVSGWKDADGNPVTEFPTMPDNDVYFYAIQTIDDITVTFVMFDGSENKVTGHYDDPLTAPETTVEHYTFNAWLKDGVATTIPATIPAESVTYTGDWSINTHNIRWMYTDETGTNVRYHIDRDVAYGTQIAAPEGLPEVTGQSVTGWKDAEGNPVTSFPTMPDADVYYYADQTVNNYTLTFVDVDHEGAVVTTYLTNDQMHYGDAIEAPANPTKTGGYTFNGWNYPATVDPDTLTMPAADVQVTAKWVGAKVTTVWIDGTDILWTNTKQEIGKEIDKPSGKTLANILARTSENKWLDPDDLWDPQPGFAEGDAMFNLKWKSEFTVSFEANGIVIKELGHIREGQTISADDAPVARKDGKDAKWLLDGELFGFDTTPVESNLTLVASWDDTPATSADFTYNMTLTENLNMKFFVRNVTDNIDDYTVKVSIDGEDDQFFYLDNAEENIFTIAEFDARRMTDEIHVFVTDGDAVVLDKVYTIAGYCNAVIESTGNQKLKELANAILVYGAQAQLALNYQTGKLPTEDYDVSGVIIPTATATTKGSVTGVSKFGNQVMVDSNVTLRVLLQVDSTASVGDYTVTVNDTEVVPVKQSATIWYMDIPVSALKLGERQIVYVEDDNGMATYSLNTIVPIKRISNDLTKALYAYYDAATAYATSI